MPVTRLPPSRRKKLDICRRLPWLSKTIRFTLRTSRVTTHSAARDRVIEYSSTSVLFYLTRSPALRRQPETNHLDFFEYPVRVLLPLAIELSQQKRRVVVYIYSKCVDLPNVPETLDYLTRLGAAIVYADDDTNLNSIISEHNCDSCVLVNGVWTFHVQVECRIRNIFLLLVEAPVFRRDDAIFVDPIGVTTFSSLAAFRPSGSMSPHALTALNRLRFSESADRPINDPYILLLLEHRDTPVWPLASRYSDVSNVIADLSKQFPNRKIAVRAHPHDSSQIASDLPSNCFLANAGPIGGWAQYCDWAIGLSSKATFCPLVYEKPVIVLARGLTNYFNDSPVFIQTNNINQLSDENIHNRFNKTTASEFVAYLFLQHHFLVSANKDVALAHNLGSPLYQKLLGHAAGFV